MNVIYLEAALLPPARMPTRTRPADPTAALDALPPALGGLARLGTLRAYRRGTLLMEEGDGGDTLYVILTGRVRAYSLNAAGDRELTYGTYGPGEYIGEMSLDGGLRSASVVAVETTQCAVVTRPTLVRYIGEHPEFAFVLLAKVIRRARAATLTARQMVLNDVYGRVKALFEAEATLGADGRLTVAERMTHKDIASRAGCSREMVTRVMKELLTGGYVDRVSPPLALLKALPQRW